ncbi:hypothetical protein ACFFX0_14990 [Citricoccus parietis]|uniref:Uncharacterized protein n=1 Tax=Citricoccus parietis TaxID=592307 RepID=A0ABV5G0H8_9MICC
MHVSHRAASAAVGSGSISPWEINRIRATCSELRISMPPPSLGTVCHGALGLRRLPLLSAPCLRKGCESPGARLCTD